MGVDEFNRVFAHYFPLAHLPVHEVSALQADALLPAQQPAPGREKGVEEEDEVDKYSTHACVVSLFLDPSHRMRWETPNSLSWYVGPLLPQVLPNMTGEGEGDLTTAHLPEHEASALQADALLPAQQPVAMCGYVEASEVVENDSQACPRIAVAGFEQLRALEIHDSLARYVGLTLPQVLPTMTGEGGGDLTPAHLPVQEVSALHADALLLAQQPVGECGYVMASEVGKKGSLACPRVAIAGINCVRWKYTTPAGVVSVHGEQRALQEVGPPELRGRAPHRGQRTAADGPF